MILGGWTAGVWILMEKTVFRCNFTKIRKIPEKYGNILFYRKTKEDRRRSEGGLRGPTPPRRGPTWVWPTCSASDSPPSPISSLWNPNTRGATTYRLLPPL